MTLTNMIDYYSDLIGNKPIKRFLGTMVEKNAIANSLLFVGPEGVGKSLFAEALALQLVGASEKTKQHPDIHSIYPEGKLGLHSIQSLRQLIDEVHLPPYQSPWKVFIIHEAERMLSYSANALLKTFEEPPPHTVIILITESPTALLPTIRSRCRALHFQSVSQEEIVEYLKGSHPLAEELIVNISLQARGSIGRASQLATRGGDPLRKAMLDTLSVGRVSLYRQLTTSVKALAEQIDASKKEAEVKAKAEKEHLSHDNLSAVQLHALEKELEGAISVSFMNESRAILDHLLSWYRDLQLMKAGADTRYLLNPDYIEKLQQALLMGKIPDLEEVQKMVNETILSLQRSTSFSLCLENLFLKLGLI